jgi:hypothetical protein
MTIMAGGSKKRNPLCPLQPNELLNRGNKKTRQSQRLKEASTEEGRARITDENDDGRRATLLAGKPPPEKTKQNRGRPLGRSIQKGNTSALKSPRPTSRSKSQPTPTSMVRLPLDKTNATCLSRRHPFRLVCTNCREANGDSQSARNGIKGCEQLFLYDNCTTGPKKNTHNLIIDWEKDRLSSGLSIPCRLQLDGNATPAKKENTVLVAEDSKDKKKHDEAKNDVLVESPASEPETPGHTNASSCRNKCRGIAAGQSPALLAFVSNVFKATARYLDRCASGQQSYSDSEYALSNSIILHDSVSIEKVGADGFILKSHECETTTRSSRHAICTACNYIGNTVRRSVKRSEAVQPGTLPNEFSSIKDIATNETLAESELRRLRKQVRQQKRQIIKLQNQKNLKRYGKKATDSEAEAIIVDVFEKANGPAETFLEEEGQEEELELWKVHFESLKETHKKGGRTSGTRYDPRLLNWAIGLLAKTSHSVYADIQKVMQLPSASYVMRKSSELVSTHGTKAHSMCLNTLATIAKRLTDAGHAPGSNARKCCIAVDAANCLSGLEWDRIEHKMVGTDPSLCFEVVSKQFRAIATDAATAGDKEDEKDDVCVLYYSIQNCIQIVELD